MPEEHAANFQKIADIMATGDIGDHTGRMISLPPWDVQKAITFGVRGQIDHPEMTIAAKSALYLAICYILGFGVERDIDQMLHFMRKAAEMGVRGARHVVERLHEAFGRSCIVNFEALEDADEEEQASIIVESMKSAKYTTPWHSIDMVSQRRLSESIRKGIDPGIHHLAYLGMTDRLNELLESGVEDHQDGEGRTALYFACWGGHLSVIKALLSHGSDASIGDDDGYTPLHFLIMLPESDVAEAVSCIINSSEEVDINAFASEPLELPEGWMEISGTPLHWAIASHNITMVWALLKNGADVFSWDTGNSPIHLAASLHQYDILDILLQPENGFSIDLLRHQESPFFSLNASDPIWRTAIHGNNWKEAVSLTISALAQHWDINDLSDNQLGLTPLTKIAFANLSEVDVEIAACLLKFCIPDTRSKVFSALQSAIIGLRGVPLSSHAKIAHFMIGAGCSAHSQSSSPHNPSSRFKPGWNALHWAILQNNVSVCREILKRYQDLVHLATDDEFGDTPLNLATLGSLELIDLLLDHGADPAAESKKQGLTPLGSYLSDQRPETDTSILTRLIEISKDNDYIVFRREEECWTLLHYLSTRAAVLNMEGIQGQRLLQKVLADYPQVRALINIPTKNGWTALHLATYNVGYTAVRLLLEAGADPLLETPINGANAFNIAMERGRHAPHEQFRGSKSDIGGRWVSLAYKTLKILLRYMEDHDCFFDLSKLHLAAYIGHYEKVVRLVEKGVDPLARSEGETPAEMLRASLGGADVRFVERAEKVLGYLDGLDGRGNP
jgi:ankyrin repeat protein